MPIKANIKAWDCSSDNSECEFTCLLCLQRDVTVFRGLRDVGIDCHPDPSEGQVASAFQAMLMVCKGPLSSQRVHRER